MRDSETGKHYNYFRDYDPAIGRYLESDPIGMAAGANTYGYVGQSPLLFVDPLGLDFLDWLERRWKRFTGKALGTDAVGRVLGAKCAKNCMRFTAARDKMDIATEICIELQPGVQADIYAGSKVLQACVKHCLAFVAKECSCVT